MILIYKIIFLVDRYFLKISVLYALNTLFIDSPYRDTNLFIYIYTYILVDKLIITGIYYKKWCRIVICISISIFYTFLSYSILLFITFTLLI